MVGRDHVHRVGLDELHLRALSGATICCLCRPQSRSHQFPSSVARLHRVRFAPCRCAASTRSTSTLAAVAGSSAAIACWFTRLVCAPPGRVSCTGNQGFWPVLATPSKISSPAAGWGATSQCMVAKLLDADRCSAWCGRHLASPPPPARRHRRRHCYRRPLQPAMPCAVATVAIPDLASHRCLGCLLHAAARGSGARERPERAARGSGARQRHEAEARGSFTVPEVRVGVLARAPFFK